MGGIRCPECKAPMVLRSGRYGAFYGCSRYPACTVTCAAGADVWGRAIPFGAPADKATRDARADLQEALDELWKKGIMTRAQVPVWVQRMLKVGPEAAEVSRMSKETCAKLMQLVEWELRVPGLKNEPWRR